MDTIYKLYEKGWITKEEVKEAENHLSQVKEEIWGNG